MLLVGGSEQRFGFLNGNAQRLFDVEGLARFHGGQADGAVAVVGRADVHGVHLAAGEQIVIVRKAQILRNAEFVADFLQARGIHVADRDDIRALSVLIAAHMRADADAAHADDTDLNGIVHSDDPPYFVSMGVNWP